MKIKPNDLCDCLGKSINSKTTKPVTPCDSIVLSINAIENDEELISYYCPKCKLYCLKILKIGIRLNKCPNCNSFGLEINKRYKK
jgi:hypothetical protein